jgi:septum site-determining protein MinC
MSAVSFKGTREGLLVTFGEGAWHDLLNELAKQLERPGAQAFFRGARVLLETGDRAIGVLELEELITLLAQHQMTLTSVMGQAATQEAFDQLRTTIPPETLDLSNGQAEPAEPERPPSDETQALVIRRTIRSGQVIHYMGTVMILGDVNPGAEVIADGDVLVWGRLRGVVHAGASGDESAVVGALVLSPTQLRIGGQIARAPDGRRPHSAPAEVARVRNGQITLEPWTSN